MLHLTTSELTSKRNLAIRKCLIWELGNAGLNRDQRYRAEPWCRNTDAGLRQLTTGRNADAGLTFLRHSDIPAFTYDFSISYSKINTITNWLWTCPCRVYHFWTFHCLPFGRALHGHWATPPPPHPPTLAVWTCSVYPFFKSRNVGLYGIQSVRYRNYQKCRCRN